MADMNATPTADRLHIGIFGRRNAGKSSVINAVLGQSLAIVSDVAGTTTDPVSKAMELLPIGPVVVIDTPGIDDEGELGALRVKKSYQVLNKTDLALLVVDAAVGMTKEDEALLRRIKEKHIPYIIAMNKMDMPGAKRHAVDGALYVSAATGEGIEALKEAIGRHAPEEDGKLRIVGHLLSPSDFVVLVVPIDKAAPKGRLILPQQQTIRVLISEGCTHHRQCDDIGTVKLPRWISDYTGCHPDFSFTGGGEFPDDLSPYHLIVHCGGCMLNEREMKYRLRCAADQGVPMTNYGVLIAYIQGILKRSVEVFPDVASLLED